jgi:hypothetical protein
LREEIIICVTFEREIVVVLIVVVVSRCSDGEEFAGFRIV